MEDYIPLDKCEDGAVYEIHSRNLSVGVFVKDQEGFIGIRTKFGSRFLFTEYHWDQGAPYGTVHPIRKLDVKVPDGVKIVEYLGTIDKKTGRPADFSKTPCATGNGKAFENGKTITVKGWYYTGTGEASEDIGGVLVPNDKLFEFLDGIKL